MKCSECRHHGKGHECFPALRGKRCRGATEQLQAELDKANEQIELIEKQCQENGKSAADRFMEIEQLQAKLDKYRWIPVSERKPDVPVGPPNASSKMVWIIFRNEYQIGYYTNFAGWRVRGIRFQKRINQKDITHWMEPIILPEQALKSEVKNYGKNHSLRRR